VGWIGQGRIGVSATGRPKYEFIGTNEVRTVRTKPEVVKQVEEIIEAPVPREVRERELPSAMFPYQRESAMWLDARGSGVLALDMGLGKTLCAISVADAPIVVVCPATLRTNWVREVAMWRPDLTVASLGTGKDWAKKDKRAGVMASALKANVVVVNYDILKGEILDALIARGCETLICDEAHALKELKVYWKRNEKTNEWEPKLSGSARAINVWKLAQVAKRRFMLTGTPMINGRPYELFPLLHLVAPKEWRSFREYCNAYCAPKQVHVGRGKYATDYSGSSNLTELNEKIQGTFMLRKTKDELDLPEKSRRSTLVTLEDDAAKHYRAAAERFLAWVRENGGIEAAMRAKRAEVIAQLTALRRLCAIGKAPAVAEAAVDFCASGRPLVIMGHHREALTATVEALRAAGLKVGTIMGDDSDAERTRNKDLFQTGEPASAPPEQRQYLDVLVCSIMSAGVGLTLTRASDMFFIERAWRPFDLVQAEDRLHRIGQINKVIINYFDAAGTVDVKIAKLLANKLATAAQVIDGENLSESEAQVRVVGEMFGEGAEEFLANQSADADDDLPEWADPES
jgi:SWI/SNF-related matrix-associated actin-dependent regulator 1 of chromatin subfamily A